MKLDIGDNLVHLLQLFIICTMCCILAIWTKINLELLIDPILTVIAALAGVHLAGMKYSAIVANFTAALNASPLKKEGVLSSPDKPTPEE